MRWFELKERCPRCGLRFEREEGFFLGAYVMNYAAVTALLFVFLGGVVAIEANQAGRLLPWFVAGGVVVVVATPIVFYPFSKTLWVAIELVMRPLDPREVAAADQAEAAARPPPDETEIP